MKIKEFSDTYDVRSLTEANVEAILTLCKGNPLYYEYCPPFISKEEILEDMEAAPQGKTKKDKYYIGFYKKDQLIAVMDLIDGYPERGIAFIGFFMTDSSVQNQGVGSEIIEYLCNYFSKQGYKSVRLAWVLGNPQAEHFWRKNQFNPIKETSSNVGKRVMLAERNCT